MTPVCIPFTPRRGLDHVFRHVIWRLSHALCVLWFLCSESRSDCVPCVGEPGWKASFSVRILTRVAPCLHHCRSWWNGIVTGNRGGLVCSREATLETTPRFGSAVRLKIKGDTKGLCHGSIAGVFWRFLQARERVHIQCCVCHLHGNNDSTFNFWSATWLLVVTVNGWVFCVNVDSVFFLVREERILALWWPLLRHAAGKRLHTQCHDVDHGLQKHMFRVPLWNSCACGASCSRYAVKFVPMQFSRRPQHMSNIPANLWNHQ